LEVPLKVTPLVGQKASSIVKAVGQLRFLIVRSDGMRRKYSCLNEEDLLSSDENLGENWLSFGRALISL